MPSGKTHDAITIALAPAVFAGAFAATWSYWLAVLVTGGLMFGGFMFGPDLDTASKQYSRWWIFKFLWFPYRTFFKHRSRWSHGLIFGTLLRVVYFMGIATCVAFLVAYLTTTLSGREIPDLWNFARAWEELRRYSDQVLAQHGLAALFLGMWIGAASHTFTDLAGSYIKTGRAGL